MGLAQLHQLRGRVGRGDAGGDCVLLFQPPLSAHGRERLAVLRDSDDGFVISEKDLQLRGPGEWLGTRQTGVVAFKIADLREHASLFGEVARVAAHLHQENPQGSQQLIQRWLPESERFTRV